MAFKKAQSQEDLVRRLAHIAAVYFFQNGNGRRVETPITSFDELSVPNPEHFCVTGQVAVAGRTLRVGFNVQLNQTDASDTYHSVTVNSVNILEGTGKVSVGPGRRVNIDAEGMYPLPEKMDGRGALRNRGKRATPWGRFH